MIKKKKLEENYFNCKTYVIFMTFQILKLYFEFHMADGELSL